MKRMLLSAATSSLLAIAAPGVAAAAHQGKRHHRAHHSHRNAHRNAHRARMMVFGAAMPAGSGATGTTAPTTPATTPTTPGTAGETAGTVTSFTAGVLTITLTDGTVVSGKVTENTEIQCQSAVTAGGSGDDQGEDVSGSDDGQGTTGQAQARMSSHDGGSGGGDGQDGEDGQSGEGHQDGGESQAACTAAALVPGAVVREAELSVSSAGAVWHQVDLVQ